ncbi:MAG: TVP38/TMEM64 family protein [Lewinella sp.]
MKKFWHLSLAVFLFFLCVFALSVMVGVSFDSVVADQSKFSGYFGAFLSIMLLIADLFLPVPSSLIMIGNGALYGPFWGGLVSLAGGAGAVLVGYFLGQKGEQTVLRWMDKSALKAAHRFFDQYGILAVAISRPIPLLAETIAVLAGLSGWGLGKTMLSAVIGLLPVAFIYAYSGAFAAQEDFGVSSFLIVIALSAVSWLIGKLFFNREHSPTASVSADAASEQ